MSLPHARWWTGYRPTRSFGTKLLHQWKAVARMLDADVVSVPALLVCDHLAFGRGIIEPGAIDFEKRILASEQAAGRADLPVACRKIGRGRIPARDHLVEANARSTAQTD